MVKCFDKIIQGFESTCWSLCVINDFINKLEKNNRYCTLKIISQKPVKLFSLDILELDISKLLSAKISTTDLNIKIRFLLREIKKFKEFFSSQSTKYPITKIPLEFEYWGTFEEQNKNKKERGFCKIEYEYFTPKSIKVYLQKIYKFLDNLFFNTSQKIFSENKTLRDFWKCNNGIYGDIKYETFEKFLFAEDNPNRVFTRDKNNRLQFMPNGENKLAYIIRVCTEFRWLNVENESKCLLGEKDSINEKYIQILGALKNTFANKIRDRRYKKVVEDARLRRKYSRFKNNNKNLLHQIAKYKNL